MEALRLLGSGSSQEIDQAIQPYSMTQEGRVAILRCIPGLLEPECPIRWLDDVEISVGEMVEALLSTADPQVADDFKLRVHIRRTLADAGLSTASQLTTLDCSNLGLCHLSPGILATLSSLQSINLSHNLLDDASVVDVGLEALANTLTSLDVSDNQIMAVESLCTLVATFPHLTSASVLGNPCCIVDSPELRATLLPHIPACVVPDVHVALNGSRATVAERMGVAGSLKAQTRSGERKGMLAALRLSLLVNGAVEAAGVPHTQLTALDLSGQTLRSVRDLNSLSHQLPQLTSLDLSHNCLERLAGQGIETLPALRTLDIRWNAVGSLLEVVRVGAKCRSLTTLYIQHAVTDGTTSEPHVYAPSVCARLRGLVACDDVRSSCTIEGPAALSSLNFLGKVLGIHANGIAHVDLRHKGLSKRQLPYILAALSQLPVSKLYTTGNPWDTDDSGEPVSHRDQILHAIPHLTSIDSSPVTSEERAALRRQVSSDRADTLARHAWDVMEPLAGASGLFPAFTSRDCMGAGTSAASSGSATSASTAATAIEIGPLPVVGKKQRSGGTSAVLPEGGVGDTCEGPGFEGDLVPALPHALVTASPPPRRALPPPCMPSVPEHKALYGTPADSSSVFSCSDSLPVLHDASPCTPRGCAVLTNSTEGARAGGEEGVEDRDKDSDRLSPTALLLAPVPAPPRGPPGSWLRKLDLLLHFLQVYALVLRIGDGVGVEWPSSWGVVRARYDWAPLLALVDVTGLRAHVGDTGPGDHTFVGFIVVGLLPVVAILAYAASTWVRWSSGWRQAYTNLQRGLLLVCLAALLPSLSTLLTAFASEGDQHLLAKLGCTFTKGVLGAGQPLCCLRAAPTKPCMQSHDWAGMGALQAVGFALLTALAAVLVLLGRLIKRGQAQVRDAVKPGWASLDDQDASTEALLQQLVLRKYRSPSARVDLAVEAVRRMQATAKVQRDTVFAQLVASSPDLPQRLLVEGYRAEWFWYPVVVVGEKSLLLLLALCVPAIPGSSVAPILSAALLTATAILSLCTNVYLNRSEGWMDAGCRVSNALTAIGCAGLKLRPRAASGALGTALLCAFQGLGLCVWLLCALGVCPMPRTRDRFGPADDSMRVAPKRPSLIIPKHHVGGDSSDLGTENESTPEPASDRGGLVR